jgi:hypothetical protein
MMSNKESKKDNFVIKGIYLGGMFFTLPKWTCHTVAQSKNDGPFGRPPAVSHRRKFRWVHRGVGLCRGRWTFWGFDPAPDGNRFLSRFLRLHRFFEGWHFSLRVFE